VSEGPTRTPEPLVLFVCHANTARSVMAHVMLEKMLAEHGVRARVRSAGIANWARDGMLPSLDARIVLREHGIHLGEDDVTSTDLRRHPELLREAALILTMTAEQRDVVRDLVDARGRPVYTLGEFAGDGWDIADPAMRGEDAFRVARDVIKGCLEKALPRLLKFVT
jgi:protein-tyrosine-phosphatase